MVWNFTLCRDVRLKLFQTSNFIQSHRQLLLNIFVIVQWTCAVWFSFVIFDESRHMDVDCLNSIRLLLLSMQTSFNLFASKDLSCRLSVDLLRRLSQRSEARTFKLGLRKIWKQIIDVISDSKIFDVNLLWCRSALNEMRFLKEQAHQTVRNNEHFNIKFQMKLRKRHLGDRGLFESCLALSSLINIRQDLDLFSVLYLPIELERYWRP